MAAKEVPRQLYGQGPGVPAAPSLVDWVVDVGLDMATKYHNDIPLLEAEEVKLLPNAPHACHTLGI